ncbi:MAG: hypothetical protein ORN27_04885 [Rhodoluna sp.]|nr:hypothetical protein [Rhodoluna sp.]
MSSITTQIKEFREDRISRILDEGTPQLLNQPLLKRALAALAVISSWVTFITLLIATHPQVSGDFKTLARWRIVSAAVMVLSFLFLRVAMRRVTSLPEEFLDEREQTNRDWAFRTGYLVIRRVGLTLVIGVVCFIAGAKYFENHAFNDNVMWFYNLNQSAVGYFTELISTVGPFEYFAWLAFVLTYVAYSFPLILLAWREANDGIVVQARRADLTELQSLATRYFRKLWRVAIFGLLAIVSMFTYSLFAFGFIWVIIAWSAYGLYVYLWATSKLAGILISLRETELGDTGKATRRSLLKAFTLSSASGVLIILMFFFATLLGVGLLPAFLFGFAGVILHLYCFASVRRIAYIMAASERG